jgi:hypothetical protein
VGGQPRAEVDVSKWVSIEAEEIVFWSRYGLCGTEPPDLLDLAQRLVGKKRVLRAPRKVIGDHGDSFSVEGWWFIRLADDITDPAQFNEVISHEMSHVWFNRTWGEHAIHVPEDVREACANSLSRALRMPRDSLRALAAEGCSFGEIADRLCVPTLELFLRFEDLHRARAAWGERDDDLRLVPRGSSPPESGVRAAARTRRPSSPRLKVGGS